MKELDWIARILGGGDGRGAGVRVGIGDDCAVLRLKPGEEMVVTTDFCLEGRHFRTDWHTAESAGWRCLARGLSDVAAMGGRPVAAFLSLALPRGVPVAWVDGFFAGFRELGARHGVGLAGGDTAESPAGAGVLADVMVVGAVRRGRALLRSGAQAGDGVYVTGQLGASAAELARMAAGERGGRGRQAFPDPRVAVGLALARRNLVTACMDLSDGLSSDARHLCQASGVGLSLDDVPVADGATLEQALDGGEDYELLFTAPDTPPRKLPRKLAGIAITRIGTVVAEPGVRFRGQTLPARGWEHFTTQADHD